MKVTFLSSTMFELIVGSLISSSSSIISLQSSVVIKSLIIRDKNRNLQQAWFKTFKYYNEIMKIEDEMKFARVNSNIIEE